MALPPKSTSGPFFLLKEGYYSLNYANCADFRYTLIDIHQ